MHTIRDWRGNKAKLSSYTEGELVTLLKQSADAQQQIARFAHEVSDELARRRPAPAGAPTARHREAG